MTETMMNVTAFKAKCSEIFDQLAAGEIDKVTVTKRGRVVGVLTRPEPKAETLPKPKAETWEEWVASMKGSVVMPPGFDPTAPAFDGVWDAEMAILHR